MSDLDATLKSLQQQSVIKGKSLSGEESVKQKSIPKVKKPDAVCDEEMNELAASIDKY